MDGIIALIVLGTSIWVLIDAKRIGVRKGLVKGMANMGPWAWFLVCLLLWIVAFPWYLVKRGAFKEAARAAQSAAAPAMSMDSMAQLEKLGELRGKGLLTEEEFVQKKKQLLGS